METAWSLDYCLACDRQTAGEPYCSQVCRLADLETSSCGSEPTSPIESGSPRSLMSSSRCQTTGFHLPPAFDFAAYRSSHPSLQPTPRPSSNAFFSSPPPKRTTLLAQPVSSPRVLSPSSSRSSLTSIQSASAQENCLSSQARTELRQYTSSFDQVRDWKRRMTTS